jgi:hypothetical protein
MNLIFPTPFLFPRYPTPPTAGDDAAAKAFFDALKEFFQDFVEQCDESHRYFEAANFYANDGQQENLNRSLSEDVSAEAITAVIRNLVQPTKRELVWDTTQGRWVIKFIPV